MEQENRIILFQENKIRRVDHEGEWWFNIVDIISVLTESRNPRMYWAKLKERMATTEGAAQTLTNCQPLKFDTLDGKRRNMDAANTEGVLRIIQSVPSPKAEPFKMWLARVGKERIDEIENPEIGFERLKEIYRLKGYPDEWIETRLKSIDIRKQLTEEWKDRGVKEGQEYAILTAEIAKATFGLSPTEHKQLKGLDRHNLRDHMTNLELIFTMLGEETTRQVAIRDDAQGFLENHEAAIKGGNMAGAARQNYEKENLPVVSSQNYLKQIEEAEKNNTHPSDKNE